MMCKYRVILSIDGGGIKGVIPLRILDYLQQSLLEIDDDIDITSWVDVFSSTSASSIFTGALMLRDEKGKTIFKPNDLLNFYKKRGHQLFTPKTISDSTHFPLKFVLNHFFGDIKTRNLKNHFLFYALNQAKNQLVPFSTMSSKYHDLSLGKVMRAQWFLKFTHRFK